MALSLTGCGDDGQGSTGPQAEDIPDRQTLDNLLDFYVYAHEHKDIEMYSEYLHDMFLFVGMAPLPDVPGLPSGDCTFGKTRATEMTDSLFNDPTLTDIEMELAKEVPWVVCEEPREDTTFVGRCCRLRPLITVTFDVPGGDPDVYVIDSVWFDIVATLQEMGVCSWFIGLDGVWGRW